MWWCDLGWVCACVHTVYIMCVCVNSSITEPYCMLIELKWFSLEQMCFLSVLFFLSPFPYSITHFYISFNLSLFLFFLAFFFLLWAFCYLEFFHNRQLFVVLLVFVPLFYPRFPFSRTLPMLVFYMIAKGLMMKPSSFCFQSFLHSWLFQ